MFFDALMHGRLTQEENERRKLSVFPKMNSAQEPIVSKSSFSYQHENTQKDGNLYIALPEVLCNDVNYQFNSKLRQAFQQPWTENPTMFV